MKTVAIALARMNSTRFPGKVLKDLDGSPVMQWTVNALKYCPLIDEVIVATSVEAADDVIELYCNNHKIKCFRGSLDDVLDRFYQAATWAKADLVVRATCDCPFLDAKVIEEVIRLRGIHNADYASNVDP